MTDALRDRIAAVLFRCDWGDRRGWHQASDNFKQVYRDDADAVIRELGLETQCHYDPDCEFYRYVTDWIDPQTHQRVDLP